MAPETVIGADSESMLLPGDRTGLGCRPRFPADQQPDWHDLRRADEVIRVLAGGPGLVTGEDVRSLRRQLARVANGDLAVIQAGDCAEDPAQCTPEHLELKADLLTDLADAMAPSGPVIKVGRIAGQFAKPRSVPTELVDGRRLPVYRGPMVNGPEPDPWSRRHDPLRMLTCYDAARAATRFLRGRLWTSHEALVLDYELSLLRREPDGRLLLASTHWPWIGDRTRRPDSAHVRLLARVDNPVAVKIGPTATAPELVRLCGLLDPEREPGRLTLIARQGAGAAATRLPELVTAARRAGHPVIWMCDPMHGNTELTPDGRKTRFLPVIAQEVSEFRAAVTQGGGVVGGLHLEATPEAVTECVWDEAELGARRGRENGYTSLCDPRLNPAQAIAIARLWSHREGAADCR